MIERTASAACSDDLKSGRGTVSVHNGVLDKRQCGFNTRLDKESATNQAELIGSAHADGCYVMVFAK